MSEIRLENQPFDITFHPTEHVIYTGLLTGEIKAFKYSGNISTEDEFTSNELFSARPTKRSCRGLALNTSGDRLYGVTKDKTLHEIDTANGVLLQSTLGAHEASINRVILTMPNMLATGDDDGVIKLWDPRKKGEIRAYTHHSDYISDFMWVSDKKHLVATSADGTLSVLDVRANKTGPFAESEDQDDELLSIVSFKGGTRTIVGTQSGILEVFNRSAGWGDCVDRIPGHPASVDAMYVIPDSILPASSPSDEPPPQAILATGSSDGLVRLVQLFPTKILGVVADHGDFPVERIRIDMPANEGSERWLASIGHDERIILTDLKGLLEESDEEDGDGADLDVDDNKAIDEGGSEGPEPEKLLNPDGKTVPVTTYPTPLDSFSFSKKSASLHDSDSDSDSDDSETDGGPPKSSLPRIRKASHSSEADSDSEADAPTAPPKKNTTKRTKLEPTPTTVDEFPPKGKGKKGRREGAATKNKKHAQQGDVGFFDEL